MKKTNNIYMHRGHISSPDREKLFNQRGCVLWLTGLSGSGKSTIGYALEKKLIFEKKFCFVLDGDNVRHGLNSNLGFSVEDRRENIRRVSEVGALFADSGTITIASFISPLISIREDAKNIIGAERFFEIFINTPLSTCEKRDPKKLYKKARSGELKNFTGISAPYEKPVSPALELMTETMKIEECVSRIIEFLQANKFILS